MNLKCLRLTMAVALVTVGCGQAVKSAADYNRTVHLPDYHTFFMVKGNSSGNALLDQRATANVEAALMSKGWEEVPPGEGRAVVVVHAATQAKHSYEMFYEGWGGWQWRGAAAGTPVAPDYKAGTVVVDIFDADTQQTIWRGSAGDALSDHQKDGFAAGAVSRMFSRFPPEQWPPLASPRDLNRRDADADAKIYFAQSPALLIPIDGEPVYQPVEGTDLERIVNTKTLIVRDHADIHYLKIRDGWMEAYSLSGDWSVSGVAPPGGLEALEGAVDANLDLLAGERSQPRVPSLSEQAPAIYVSTTPAQLIITDGPEQYKKVEGTSLEYLANTTGNVFREPTDQQLYALVSGRWFRAWTTDGPWRFMPGSDLPADIARRSDTSAKPDP
jgi:hypothetical protein